MAQRLMRRRTALKEIILLAVAILSSAYGRGYGQRRSEAILKALLAEEMH